MTEGSFEEFYAATYHRLLKQLVLVTGDRHGAEDVLQEAYGRAAATATAAPAGAALLSLVLAGLAVAGGARLVRGDATQPPTGERPRPPVTTLQPVKPEQLIRPLGLGGRHGKAQLVGPLRPMAEGTVKGRHWALYLFLVKVSRAGPPAPAELRWCKALVDWRPNGDVFGWTAGCDLQKELRPNRTFTVGLDELVENQVFLYRGTVTKRAARIRFQVTGQQPFEAQRIVDLDPQSPNNWYLAFFSPKGGTRAMLDPHLLTKATVLDAAGRVICSQTSGRYAPPTERDGCA